MHCYAMLYYALHCTSIRCIWAIPETLDPNMLASPFYFRRLPPASAGFRRRRFTSAAFRRPSAGLPPGARRAEGEALFETPQMNIHVR